MIRYTILAICFVMLAMYATPASAKTLVVEGKLDGIVTVKKNVTFSADETLSKFTYQFSVPSVYDNAGNVQRLDDFKVSATPQPAEAKETTDQYGNRSRKLIWHDLRGDAQVTVSYTTEITATISPRTSQAPFPLKTVPKTEQGFLKKSKLVQSDSSQITELAAELTSGATTEHVAVSAILTHVADAIKYQYNPKQYDALYGLTTGTGNCQNFSHLAIALLRASGIPARISVGQALKDKWKIPLDKKGSSLVQGMGEGLHAWIEVWYPDLGWMPCDPQQSRLFTSTRHIKFGHGMDASDVLEYWSGAPVVPRMSESLEAKYSTDTVDLRLREATDTPSSYLLAGPVTATAVVAQNEPPVTQLKPVPQPAKPKPAPVKPDPAPAKPVVVAADEPPIITPPPRPKPKPVKPKPAPEEQKTGTHIEIGNMDFPNLVEGFKVDGNVGQKSFDRETAEYATSKHLFAQAFTINSPLSVKDVALAMRKFGGDGTVYLDVVRDVEGKPSLDGVRSTPVSLEKVTRKPGYYWVNFSFPENTTLAPGKHWMVLRHSGEAIMNWFYTPGKRINGPDDSRSTAQGWQWEDVLTGEFVYRVRGVVAKQ
jgi:transglutaminase-like putative cysteine protease